MYDLALDPLTGDIAGPQVGGYLISGAARIAQEVRMRLQTHLGEYFLDTRIGLPWASWMSDTKVTNRLLRTIEALVRVEVLEVAGVMRLEKPVKAQFDQDKKKITITVSYVTSEGTTTIVVYVDDNVEVFT